jgi:hypothetical protein
MQRLQLEPTIPAPVSDGLPKVVSSFADTLTQRRTATAGAAISINGDDDDGNDGSDERDGADDAANPPARRLREEPMRP